MGAGGSRRVGEAHPDGDGTTDSIGGPEPSGDLVDQGGERRVDPLLVGLAVDVGLRGGLIGVGSAVAITAVAAGILVLAPDRPAERWVFAALAVVTAGGLVLRASPWIVVLDWFAALGFLGLAASTSPDRPVIGSSLTRLVWRSGAAPTIGSLLGLSELARAVDVVRRRPKSTEHQATALQSVVPALVRGLALTAPIVLVLGLLLASADGVFASFFDVPTPDVGQPWLHLFLVGLGACVVSGLGRWSRSPEELKSSSSRPLGSIETLVVLSGLALLYGLFAVAQLVASTGGDDRVQDTTGLTYAEYARNGFFQLLWAAAITIVVLLGLRALSRPGGRASQVAIRGVSAITS